MRDAVVLGIPRGGVVVAAEVARELGLPLDVIVAAKIGAPGNPEYAIGSVTADGAVLANAASGYAAHEVEQLSGPAKAKVAQRILHYHRDGPAESIAGRVAIIVDDGLATGLTAEAAAAYARRQGAARVVLAVPVASESAVRALKSQVDDLVALEIPAGFAAVGQFYAYFDQTSDKEVERLLAGGAGQVA